MTLRARLSWGLFAITLVLIVPLLLSLRSLEHLYGTSRLLRDREFAASLLLGSFHERTDDARRAEDALLFIHDQKSAARMEGQIDGLVSLTDSLDRYHLDLSATQIRASLDALRSAAREEYQQAAAGRGAVAEQISQRRTRPAIASVDSALGASETTLRQRTRQLIADATNETFNAERFVGDEHGAVRALVGQRHDGLQLHVQPLARAENRLRGAGRSAKSVIVPHGTRAGGSDEMVRDTGFEPVTPTVSR